jgi:hypothetical protein
MTELRFNVSMLLSEIASRVLTPDSAVKDLENVLQRERGWLPGVSFQVKSTERVIPQSEVLLGDKIRLFDGAFGDALVTEIRAGMIYCQRPYMLGMDVPEEERGKSGVERVSMYMDSDRTVVLLERMKVPTAQ